MSYIEKTLGKDEKIEFKGRVHWINYVGCIFAPIIILFKIIVLFAITKHHSRRYNLLNNRRNFFFSLTFLLSLFCIGNYSMAENKVSNSKAPTSISTESKSEKEQNIMKMKKDELIKMVEKEKEKAYIILALIFLSILYEILVVYTKEFVVTNRRIIQKQGVFLIKTEELRNSQIEAVELSQSILGRIFNYGTILFSGTGISNVTFKSIENPIASRIEIENAIYQTKK